MNRCPASGASGLIERLFDVVDCHIRTVAQQSYADLVGPGTLFANVFTVLLTVYIALIGYQMLIGRGGFRLAQMPVEALKIGLILAFTTSWATYQTVIYDFFFDGPRQMLSIVLQSSGRAESGDLYAALEGVYVRLTEAAATFGAMGGPGGNVLQGGPTLGSGLLWLAAIGVLLSTVGLILAAKIVLGLLLALGPVFVGLFLFDATRGFFDGWLRAVVAFAFAPLAASVFALGLVMMLDPFLVELATLVSQRRFDMGAVLAIVLIVAVFLIVMSQVLRISNMIASGFASKTGTRPTPTSAQSTEALASPRSATRSEIERTAPPLVLTPDAAIAGADRRVFMAAEHVTGPAVAAPRLEQSYRRLPRPARSAGGEP